MVHPASHLDAPEEPFGETGQQGPAKNAGGRSVDAVPHMSPGKQSDQSNEIFAALDAMAAAQFDSSADIAGVDPADESSMSPMQPENQCQSDGADTLVEFLPTDTALDPVGIESKPEPVQIDPSSVRTIDGQQEAQAKAARLLNAEDLPLFESLEEFSYLTAGAANGSSPNGQAGSPLSQSVIEASVAALKASFSDQPHCPPDEKSKETSQEGHELVPDEADFDDTPEENSPARTQPAFTDSEPALESDGSYSASEIKSTPQDEAVDRFASFAFDGQIADALESDPAVAENVTQGLLAGTTFAAPSSPLEIAAAGGADVLEQSDTAECADAVRDTHNIIRELLDFMARPTGVVQPQERALAADTLLRMLNRMSLSAKRILAERVSIMEDPPAMIVSKLVKDSDVKVAAPLIDHGTVVSDQDLFAVIETGDLNKCRMIARRRSVSPGLSAALVGCGDPAVLLALVRNPEASLSPALMRQLTELAKTQPALQAPLATRPDMTPQIAFDLFWPLPTELRRYVFSRFLTDSKSLERILRIAIQAEGELENEENWDGKFFPPKDSILQVITLIEQGMIMNATRLMADCARISEANASRIIADPGGEPLTVVFKAMGLSRANFANSIKVFRSSPSCLLREDRDAEELQVLFDGLSFNKARVVLTYWDWLAKNSGPYSDEHGDLAAAI